MMAVCPSVGDMRRVPTPGKARGETLHVLSICLFVNVLALLLLHGFLSTTWTWTFIGFVSIVPHNICKAIDLSHSLVNLGDLLFHHINLTLAT